MSSDFDHDAGEAALTVTLDGQTSTVPWKAEQMLLEALEAAGLHPPYSCRSGNCGACICSIESGEIEMLHNEMLDAADIAEKLILSCQARPRSAAVTVVY